MSRRFSGFEMVVGYGMLAVMLVGLFVIGFAMGGS